MTIQLLLFAHLRERFRRQKMQLEVSEGAQAGHLISFLTDDAALTMSLLRFSRFAVNGEYVSAEFPLEDGMEVALIPPTNGG